jgi:alkanesulfonate monooxygenase SsuD/methylene tetrahydromethanopterin reductase-like flavin-dependent oxidoreductase (luciferase family)
MTLRIGVLATAFDADGVEFVRQAERLGADCAWSLEFWAGDAFTPLAYLAGQTSTIRLATGIAQLGARTPAMLAMSALSMQALSGGRFILGLGVSGPQVMEGWHGVRFDRPLQNTRETIEILRKVSAGERLAYNGKIYTLPLPGGEGRPIRSLMPPTHVPIYVAALGPANLRLTGELADGWIGNSFFPETAEVFLDPAEAAGRSLATSISPYPPRWSSPTMSRKRVAATQRGMRSPSVRWGRRPPTSTTRRSPGRASGTTCARFSGCGCPVTRTRPASGSPSRRNPSSDLRHFLFSCSEQPPLWRLAG